MTPFRSSASFGKRQEYSAIAELLRRGHDVYQTLIDDQGIDCIIRKVVDGTPTYIDLQIKARSKECKPFDAARFAAFAIKDPRANFLFLFYAEWLNTNWVMPSLDLAKSAHRNKTGKNIGKYEILLSGMSGPRPTINRRFDKYRDDKGFKILEDTFTSLSRKITNQESSIVNAIDQESFESSPLPRSG